MIIIAQRKIFQKTGFLNFYDLKTFLIDIFNLMLNFSNKNLWAMDYKKKSLKKISCSESYEEIDTRLASGWYVDTIGNGKKKKYKTNEVLFTISKKQKK